MATKLYFHNASNALVGSFPAAEQSAAILTANATAVGANTLRTMNTQIGLAMTNLQVTTLNSTAAQSNFMGFFCSPPLAGNQTVGGGTMILNAAEQEANLASNWWINSLHIYVWRPSNGTLVGRVRDAANVSLGGSEPTATNSTQVSHVTGITSSAVSALDGDVVICEVWVRATQGMATGYSNRFYFDGTTENTTENAVVTNHASYIELTENLAFKTGAVRSFVVTV